jgi:hypothetical protein
MDFYLFETVVDKLSSLESKIKKNKEYLKLLISLIN